MDNEVQETCSSPICPLRSHFLVCIKNHLYIVGIGPIFNRELKSIFRSGPCVVRLTICVIFVYTKTQTLCITQLFIGLLNLAEGGGRSFICKKNAPCVPFLYAKKHFRYVFIYKKPDTLHSIFKCKKRCTLRYIFMSKSYRIVLIPNYKRTYDQINQIGK